MRLFSDAFISGVAQRAVAYSTIVSMNERSCIVKTRIVIVLTVLLSAAALFSQTAPEGIWQGYDGEWKHVSSQLIALAEATPPKQFAWRPAPGVRSTSEVYMHIVLANFYLVSKTGPKMPADLKEDAEKTDRFLGVFFQVRGHFGAGFADQVEIRQHDVHVDFAGGTDSGRGAPCKLFRRSGFGQRNQLAGNMFPLAVVALPDSLGSSLG